MHLGFNSGHLGINQPITIEYKTREYPLIDRPIQLQLDTRSRNKLEVTFSYYTPCLSNVTCMSKKNYKLVDLNQDDIIRLRNILHEKTDNRIKLRISNDSIINNNEIPEIVYNNSFTPPRAINVRNEYRFPVDDTKLFVGYIPKGETDYKFCPFNRLSE